MALSLEKRITWLAYRIFAPPDTKKNVLAFYVNKLGFEMIASGLRIVSLKLPAATDFLIELVFDEKAKPGATGLLFHVTNLEAAFNELAEADALLDEQGCFSGEFSVRDPAGNTLSFAQLPTT